MKLPSEKDEIIGKKVNPKAKRSAAQLPPKKERRPFTKQVETFIEEMANPSTKSATEAAIKAGSPAKSARVTASRWLTNANISAEIQERVNQSLAHAQVTREEVLGNAAKQMRSSMDDLIDEQGFFDLTKARETGAIDLVKKMEIIESLDVETNTKTVRHKVEFESPSAARKELGNYLGMEKAPSDSTVERHAAYLAFGAFLSDKAVDELPQYITEGAVFFNIKEVSLFETSVKEFLRVFGQVAKEWREKNK